MSIEGRVRKKATGYQMMPKTIALMRLLSEYKRLKKGVRELKDKVREMRDIIDKL